MPSSIGRGGIASSPSPNPTPGLCVSGEYIGAPQSIAASATLVGNGVQYFVPVWISRPVTLDRLAVNVTIVGGTGSLMRMGIYYDNGAHTPGTLLLDGGTVDTNGATGLRTVTISQGLGVGLWWFSAAQQANPSPAATVTTIVVAHGAVPTAAPTQPISTRYKTGITGAFVDASGLTTSDGSVGIRVMGRIV